MDESYIHHHYARHNDSLYHPDDATDAKPKHKGRRLCFIAAIMANGRDDSKLLTYDVLEGGRKQPKDYHAMFNHAYFVAWFQRLLDDVSALQKTNAIIVLDNAKYHKGLPDDTPKGAWTKARMLAACETYGIELDVKEYRSTLWAKLKTYVTANVVPVIVQMAKDRGHDVVFTPPYHSDLQPIEMVWSFVKGAVGRQYDTSTKFPDVRERLDREFDRLPSSVIFDCIGHTDRKVVDMAAYLNAVAEADDAAGAAYSSESESESDADSCDECNLGDYGGDE
ncbi:hypothetical protein DYB31_016267 [Aphanomyces astaci]|uniref:Tc1-like transposase DDE domain-containing protein n=1 Tax=Aphanomyces astaci TaxID=112090 RepID=A0A397FUC7_APHAT|nr:hypothetical protein DYB31_016267 [Aphanomyces astaci]